MKLSSILSKEKRRGATVAGVFGVALSCALLLCGAGSAPLENFLPQGAMQGDLNAGGYSLTNAATLNATNVVIGGAAMNAANGLAQLDSTGALAVPLVNNLSPNSGLTGFYLNDARGDNIDLTDDGSTYQVRIENSTSTPGSYLHLGYGTIDIEAQPSDPVSARPARLSLGGYCQIEIGSPHANILTDNFATTASRTWVLPDESGTIAMTSDLPGFVTAPSSSTASGTAGQIAHDSGYFYICVASNTWKRAALSTW